MKYGYARVSTEDQNPALQIAALKKAKCAHIFQDKRTGSTTKRPQLEKCLKKTLRAGDTLIVWKLDRLGRSVRDLITILDDLRDRGIRPGPKKKLTRQQIEHARELRKKGKPPDAIADIFRVSRATVYRALNGEPLSG
jgi:DNA invertase Pin-like site-specific DNA recombinase